MKESFVAKRNDVDGCGRRQASCVHDRSSHGTAEERRDTVANLTVSPDLRLRELDPIRNGVEARRFPGGDDAGALGMDRNEGREGDRKSTRLNSSHLCASRIPSSART